MPISINDNQYKSVPKQKWRTWIHNLLNPSKTHLVDSEGVLKYKWLEPVGDRADTFLQLLNTSKVPEKNLIGIDYDPEFVERSISNIDLCKTLFPEASFHATEWTEFCAEYEENDIAVFVFDFYTSTFGTKLNQMLRAAIPLIDACKSNLGEVILVVNADIGFAKRQNKGSSEVYAKEIENILQYSIHPQIRNIKINRDTCYIYKQTANSTEMASFAILM